MSIPLSERFRPNSIESIVGQKHLLDINKPLRKLIDINYVTNMIFYGPPGTGKTTLAKIISKQSGIPIKFLNGTSASSADIKDILKDIDSLFSSNRVLLYLDEIQYFNKKQQQLLLEAIEQGRIILIASTTENPSFYIYNALLSRCAIFEFKLPPVEEIYKCLISAVKFMENEIKCKIVASDNTIKSIAIFSGGDVRKALNTLEICIVTSDTINGIKNLDNEATYSTLGKSNIPPDRNENWHYDTLSAFHKSMRGSDANAAIYYLATLLESGDISSACRRILICTCEDVGLAYPQIIPIVKSCVDIALQVGMPEARIPLSNAVILICNSPKSNSAYNAINSAIEDLNKMGFQEIPNHLKNINCEKTTKGYSYLYPHDYVNHWVKQNYLPDKILNKNYYINSKNKNEMAFKEYWNKIKGK